MKPMHVIMMITVAGVILGGLLVRRHTVRNAVAVTPVSKMPVPSATKAVDAWQVGIKADTRTDYRANLGATKRLMEQLRQEERRQRPQEGRN